MRTKTDIAKALESTCGNVTHAAALLKVSKTHIMRLTAKHDLRMFALSLRKSIGRAATGKPPRI